MSRWKVSFKARSPQDPDGSEWEVGITEEHFERLQKAEHQVALARLILAGRVLESGTIAIYQGWSRPGHDDCCVYVGKPHCDYRQLPTRERGMIESTAPAKQLFLVFVRAGGTMDYWNWRPESEIAGVPEEVNGTRIWLKTN